MEIKPKQINLIKESLKGKFIIGIEGSANKVGVGNSLN